MTRLTGWWHAWSNGSPCSNRAARTVAIEGTCGTSCTDGRPGMIALSLRRHNTPLPLAWLAYAVRLFEIFCIGILQGWRFLTKELFGLRYADGAGRWRCRQIFVARLRHLRQNLASLYFSLYPQDRTGGKPYLSRRARASSNPSAPPVFGSRCCPVKYDEFPETRMAIGSAGFLLSSGQDSSTSGDG